jgi:poly(hydroxyalkanoate) depolymerase family esterase
MKPFDQFIDRMMEAARLAGRHDPHAATDVIQKALREAGLMPAAAPGTENTDTNDAPAERFVDLNAPPAWTEGGGRAQNARARWTMPPQPAEHASLRAKRKDRHTPVHPEPGQFLWCEFANHAGSRRYKLYVPARAAVEPRALIVMLHGCKQNPDDFAFGTGMNSLAEEHGCLVLYPEQARKANGSNCWNWFEDAHQHNGQGEPSIIAGMTRQVMDDYSIDPARVYVAGLSAGGAMAAVLASSYPELFAAAGVHSGLPVGCATDLPSALNAMSQAGHVPKARRCARKVTGVPVIVFHGDQDKVVHPHNGQAVLDQFIRDAGGSRHADSGRTQSGKRAATVTRVHAQGRPVAEYWVVHGAGHAWSGGRAGGSYTDPAGPDASAEMIRFFLSHKTQ